MRWLTAILAILLSVSLPTSVMAHAAEPVGCITDKVASAFGHFEGDRDEVPSDAGKGTPHHHATCHGHHVAEPARDCGVRVVGLIASLLPFARTVDGPSAPIDTTYRPPRA